MSAETVPGDAAGNDARETLDGSNELFGRPGLLVGGRYRLESLLGTGAMGEVWRARHEELHTDMAIKLANRAGGLSDKLLERFRFEAQVSAQLGTETEHVARVHDAGQHRGIPYLAMEYVPGETLDQLIEKGPLAPERVAELLAQLGDALDKAHARGILHRDVKPSNVLVARRGDGREHAKLADFGIAKAFGKRIDLDAPRTTQAGVLVGTPSYMSPEQIAGLPVDASSDRWALAICAYEALTGTLPFGAAELSDLLLQAASRPHLPPSHHVPLPPGLDAWFERALEKKPSARFASMAEMVDAFREALAAPPKRRWTWLVAALCIAGASAAGAGYWLTRDDPTPSAARATALPIAPVVAPEPSPSAAQAPRPAPPATQTARPTTTLVPAPRRAVPSASAAPSSDPHSYDDSETF